MSSGERQLQRNIPSCALKSSVDGCIALKIQRTDTQIRSEFDLVSHRMSWLMMSQSFLFIAYANLMSGLSNIGLDHLHKPLFGLCYIIPIVGMLMTIFVGVGIHAALSVANKLKNERKRFELNHPTLCTLYKTTVHRDWWEHIAGNVPSYCLPSMFFLAWVVCFVWFIFSY